MRPKDVITELVEQMVIDRICKDNKPWVGSTILNLDPRLRYLLAKLKSSDISDARVDHLHPKKRS